MSLSFNSKTTATTVYNHICKYAAPPTVEYMVTIANSWKKIKLKGILDPDSDTDTDEDGLKDWDEVNNKLISFNSNGSPQLLKFGECASLPNRPYVYNGLSRFNLNSARPSTGDTLFDFVNRDVYVLPIISDPTNKDSDGDGYDDFSDPNRLLWTDYSFLDNEIYNIGHFDDEQWLYQQIEAPNIGSSDLLLKMNAMDDTNLQKFRFKWCESGYKIYPIDMEGTNKVLTVNTTSNPCRITIETDKNSPEQLWEVLPRFFSDPYGEYSDGLIFRSKELDYTDGLGKSIYISCSSNNLYMSTERDNGTKFQIYSTNHWTRFGEAYLNYLGWENTGIGYGMISFDNYTHNIKRGLDSCNKTKINGKDLVIYQSGGAFPELNFNSVKMDGVCCEIMATYNAIALAGYQVDFFKLASECADYEAALNRASKFEILKAKVDAIECIENSYAPFGYSYIDDERYEYRWYRPKNQEEVDALNSFFNINIECNGSGDKVIGEWVGVEIDGDYDSYTGKEDVYVISSLDSSIRKLVNFYAAFGYDVNVAKIINNGESL